LAATFQSVRYFLIGPALVTALAVACTDVSIVDDDDANGDGGDHGGGSATGGAPVGGAPATNPAKARLFTEWHGTEELHGFQFWDDPDETGIDREPDGRVQISNRKLRGLAVVGETLVVYDDHGDLQLFDDVWNLTTGGLSSQLIELDSNADPYPPLRAFPELDWLWVPPRLLRNASALASTASPELPGWAEPVYDVERDRLFVLQDGEIRVIDDVSTSDTLEPSWTLYTLGDEPSLAHHLVSDGQSLFASRPTGSTFGSTQLLVWPLDVTSPASPSDLDPNTDGGVALAPIPGGGVVAISESGVWAWDDASQSSQASTGWDVQTEVLWSTLAVSQTERIYVCGKGIWVYQDPTLGEPITIGEGEETLLLIER
jgi:hypothetical protein